MTIEGDPRAITGDVGQHAVATALSRLGCHLAQPFGRERGIDLYAHAANLAQVDLVQLFSLQIKSGSSWFRERATDPEGRDCWVYRGTDAHLEYWSRLTQPHLVVLYDDDDRLAYWQRFTPQRAIRHDAGWHMHIPTQQKIDSDGWPALLNEVMAGAATAYDVLPGRIAAHDTAAATWRNALCIPRLVAPPSYGGTLQEVGPMTAMALLLQGSFHHFESPRSPVATDRKSHRWGWRFVNAVKAMVLDDHPEPLSALDAPKRAPAALAASTVARAVAVWRSASAGASRDVIEPALRRGRLVAEDRAWLHVHHAVVTAEVGHTERSALSARRALVLLEHVSGPFAAAIRSAAVNALWRVEPFGPHSAGPMANPADWWRARQFSPAASELVDQAFENWASSATRYRASDPVEDNLIAVGWSASFLGEVGPASAARRSQARYQATMVTTDNQRVRVLDELVRTGDSIGVARAVAKWSESAPAAVTGAAAIGGDGWLERSSARAAIEYYERGADVFSRKLADKATATCLSAVTDPSSIVHRTSSGSWAIRHYALRAVSNLLLVASPRNHQRVASVLTELAIDDADELDVASVVSSLNWADVSGTLRRKWIAQSSVMPANSHLSAQALVGLSTASVDASESARRELGRRFEDGDLAAAAAAGRVGLVPTPKESRCLLAVLLPQLESIRAADSYAHYTVDAAELVTWLNLGNPRIAQWDPLVRFLGWRQAAVFQKQPSVTLLLRARRRLPARARAAIRALGPRLSAAVETFDDPSILDADSIALRWSLRAASLEEIQGACLKWLRGPRPRRLAALRTLRFVPRALSGDRRGLALAALADDDPDVNANAVVLLMSDTQDRHAVRHIESVGLLTARRVAIAFARSTAPTHGGEAKRVLRRLLDHRSAAVRRAARSALVAFDAGPSE